MTRFDLYSSVHKGLRAELFAAAIAVARTDFAELEPGRAAAQRLASILAFLDEHARHEDSILLPQLAELSPALHAAVVADHALGDSLHQEIACLLERLGNSARVERSYLGKRIHEALCRLIAVQCRHMQVEELEVNAVLWAQRSDAQLGELQARIVSSIAPPRLAQWMALLVRACSSPELAAMLRGMRAAMPPEPFAQLVDAIRGELDAQAQAFLESALELSAAAVVPAGR